MSQVQLRAKARIIVQEGAFKTRETFWASEQMARVYIDQGIAEPVGQGLPQTTESLEKKSSGVVQAGQSTASAKSTEPGAAPQSSASQPDQASPKPKPAKSRLRKIFGAATGSASSQ